MAQGLSTVYGRINSYKDPLAGVLYHMLGEFPIVGWELVIRLPCQG